MANLAARVQERARREQLAISEELGARLAAYFQLLQRWNRTINLTALTDDDAGLDRLLLEPLAAARHFPSRSRLADLGSGSGSPAIPLAIALDAPRLLMVESRTRKAAFLRHAAREVGLDATVESARFEDVAQQASYRGGFDVISIRGVRPDSGALSAAAALSSPGGLIGLFVGPEGAPALSIPHDLAWRGTQPLLRSTGAQLAVLFHVEQ